MLLLTTDSSLLNPVRALTHSVSRVEQFALAKAVLLRPLAQLVGQLRRKTSELRNMLKEQKTTPVRQSSALPYCIKE